MSEQPYRMAPGMVGAEATVTPLRPVDGTVKRRRRGKGKSGPLDHLVVHPEVMKMARARRRTGERIVIVSPTEVRLVPSR